MLSPRLPHRVHVIRYTPHRLHAMTWRCLAKLIGARRSRDEGADKTPTSNFTPTLLSPLPFRSSVHVGLRSFFSLFSMIAAGVLLTECLEGLLRGPSTQSRGFFQVWHHASIQTTRACIARGLLVLYREGGPAIATQTVLPGAITDWVGRPTSFATTIRRLPRHRRKTCIVAKP
ncbi:hypothetical protein BU16DRAFT_307600 [Lophium mytilinum]|uniref:Uncharacterized protein n=1 Tax=Lophium mytilinum TaxID=390894 RepID=A0A6A6R269_9PEZI|nr:hypothetical protein BU16DRAFT_307600 [Lophium mytilinum]